MIICWILLHTHLGFGRTLPDFLEGKQKTEILAKFSTKISTGTTRRMRNQKQVLFTDYWTIYKSKLAGLIEQKWRNIYTNRRGVHHVLVDSNVVHNLQFKHSVAGRKIITLTAQYRSSTYHSMCPPNWLVV